MNLIVQRVKQTKRSTTGTLAVDGVQSFVVLEPPPSPDMPPLGNGFVCIPAGTFPLTIRWSARFQRQVPHVENVPGRTAVELHIGNFPDNTDACGLIGKDFGNPELPDYVSFSALSFAKLMNSLYSKALLTNPDAPEPEQVWNVGTITYINPQGDTQQ